VSRSSEPIFNVPAIVLAFVAAFVLVWAGEFLLLTDEEEIAFLFDFAFIPARYDASAGGAESLPGGFGPEIWTFITYGFLHGGALHLAVNSIFFLPFGSAVARRFGTARFVGFFVVTVVAGALAHFLTHRGDVQPMIGASAAVSGLMAGAMRFAFQPGGPIATFRRADPDSYRVPALRLAVAWRDVRVVVFVLVWCAANLVFGIGGLGLQGEEQSVAWQAHFGGFVVGLLLFSWFDPVPTTST